jgi:hypothetical protein
MTKIYPAFSALVLGGLGVAGFMGWTFKSYDTVPNVPKSVRDNPGAYRSHYANYYRYSGGK